MPTQTPRLNLTKPDTGNQSWETDVETWADKLDDVAAQTLTVHLGGAAIDEEIICDGFRFDVAVVVTKMTLFAREAPVGAAFAVDVLKNGVEQVQTVSLADGQQQGSGTLTGLSFSTLEDFGLKVKSVGTTVPGSEVTLLIHYQVQPVS